MFNSARRKSTINTCRQCCVALVDQVFKNLFKKMMLVLLAGITVCTLASVNGQGDTSVCSVEGTVGQFCKTCPATCSNPGLLCRAICEPGCGCPSGQLIDTTINKCVDPIECPEKCSNIGCSQVPCPPGMVNFTHPGQCCPVCVDPCDNHTCPNGSSCSVHKQTSEAFCDPSCDLDNGGCPANKHCSLEIVQCFRAPCPPVVQCSDEDPCDKHTCPTGSQCEVYKPTGKPYCMPSCDLDNGGCSTDEKCSLQFPRCLNPPCPPEVKCSLECPPKCSHEFCSNRTNRFKPCSQPSVTSPSCPDRCSTTYCGACYYSSTAVQPPFLCDNLCKYPPSSKCLLEWALCLRSFSLLKRMTKGEPSDFRCFEYVCPLRD